MAKTERLYRVESIFGGGLYRSDSRLGTRLGWREIRDIDLYSGGIRKVQEYRSLDGTHRTHLPHAPVIGSLIFGDVPKQLGFDFPRVTEDKLSYNLSPLELNMARDYLLGLSGCIVSDTPPEQLALDVTREPVVVERHIHRNGRFTLAELIEYNVFNDADTDPMLADASPNRPMPDKDGIDVRITNDHLFAFRSLERMSAWLDQAQPKQILECGAVIRVIDVRAAVHGECQSIYRKRDVVKEFAIVPGELWRGRDKIPQTVI